MNDESTTSLLDTLEKVSKIAAAVFIPVVIAWMGFRIEKRISDKSLNRDYVKIAVDILTAREAPVDSAIRVWAVDLLNDNAPTKLGPTAARRLKSGEARLPSPEGAYALMESGQISESIDAWSSLTTANAKDYFAYFHRATAHRKNGDLVRAIADLDTVIQLSPSHNTAYNNRGLMKVELGRIEEGCQDLKKAADLGNEKAQNNFSARCQ